MIKSEVVFNRNLDDTNVCVKIDGDRTWFELTDHFYNFLLGCGYQLTWEDLRAYCGEQSLDYPGQDEESMDWMNDVPFEDNSYPSKTL